MKLYFALRILVPRFEPGIYFFGTGIFIFLGNQAKMGRHLNTKYEQNPLTVVALVKRTYIHTHSHGLMCNA
jgi:hypothetical protein